MKKTYKDHDRLKNVLKITLGEEAQDRKKHNTRPQPGDVRTASANKDADRLDRAIKRSHASALPFRIQSSRLHCNDQNSVLSICILPASRELRDAGVCGVASVSDACLPA